MSCEPTLTCDAKKGDQVIDAVRLKEIDLALMILSTINFGVFDINTVYFEEDDDEPYTFLSKIVGHKSAFKIVDAMLCLGATVCEISIEHAVIHDSEKIFKMLMQRFDSSLITGELVKNIIKKSKPQKLFSNKSFRKLLMHNIDLSVCLEHCKTQCVKHGCQTQTGYNWYKLYRLLRKIVKRRKKAIDSSMLTIFDKIASEMDASVFTERIWSFL